MKKFTGLILFAAVALAVVFFAFIFPRVNNGSDYVHITALDYTAVVTDNNIDDRGKVVITERLTFDIHAATRSNGMWELWRDLPEEYLDEDESESKKVTYNVLSVTRLETDGKPAYKEFPEARKQYEDYEYSSDYNSTKEGLGPDKWFHSAGPYNENAGRWECLLIYVNNLYRETTVFEIKYEMYNASIRYADSSELYLSLFSGKDIKYLESVNAQILVPSAKMPAAGDYDFYTYGTNSHTFAYTESDTLNAGYHTFAFNLNKEQLKFKPYNRFIEFDLVAHGASKHSFTKYASTQHNYYNSNIYPEIQKAQAEYEALPSKWQNNKVIAVVILTILAAGVILLAVYADRNFKKKNKFFKTQQNFDFYRDIPSPLDATFAGALSFCKHKYSDDVPGGIAAAQLGLVQKEYIELKQINPRRAWEQSNILIAVNNRVFDPNTGAKLLPPLTQSEELFFGLIRRHAPQGQVSMDEFQRKVGTDYQNTDTFNKSMKGVVKTEGMSRGYLQQPAYKKVKKSARTGVVWLCIFGVLAMLANLISRNTRLDLAFGGFFILGAGFIAAAALLAVMSKKYVLLTQFGEDEYSKWRGLYKFLNSETLIKEKTVPDIHIWEEYLIYATAFGIPEKVIKALEVKFPQINMAANSRIIGHPYLRTRAFTYLYVRSFRNSVRTASISSRTGGMGGGGHTGGWGGGGYGGGGRGGGGGGGGH